MKLIECVCAVWIMKAVICCTLSFIEIETSLRCYIYHQQSSADKDGIAFDILLSFNLRISTFYKKVVFIESWQIFRIIWWANG